MKLPSVYGIIGKNNLIITEKGENIPPEYLESKICALPYVDECLVVLEKSRSNSILKAKIALKKNEKGKDLKSDISKINQSLPDYMHIEDFEIMDRKFEKNSSRKIKRNLYR